MSDEQHEKVVIEVTVAGISETGEVSIPFGPNPSDATLKAIGSTALEVFLNAVSATNFEEES